MDILQKYMLHALFVVHTVLPQCGRTGPSGLLKAFVSKTDKSKLLQDSMNMLSLHCMQNISTQPYSYCHANRELEENAHGWMTLVGISTPNSFQCR